MQSYYTRQKILKNCFSNKTAPRSINIIIACSFFFLLYHIQSSVFSFGTYNFLFNIHLSASSLCLIIIILRIGLKIWLRNFCPMLKRRKQKRISLICVINVYTSGTEREKLTTKKQMRMHRHIFYNLLACL